MAEMTPSARGRIVAAFFLVVIAGGITGQAVIADQIVAASDATRTAANILANRSLYRLAYTIFLIEMAAQVVVSVMFYDLLKPVNRSVARVSLAIGLTGTGIKTMTRLFFYAPLIVLGGASYMSAFTPAQLDALSLFLIKVNGQGASIAVVFLGLETMIRGWLVYRSAFLPRFLGVMSMVSGAGWVTYLWPPLASRIFLFIALTAIIGVLITCGWLFIRGIDDAKWRERALLAQASLWR